VTPGPGLLAGRFELTRKLGAGGMGEVFEALDRERDVRVALKTLPRLSALALYRFKQEFRLLSGIAHPNLISLHELINAGDQWFLTMELIEHGKDFVRFVSVGRDPTAWEDAPTSELLEMETGPVEEGTHADVAALPSLRTAVDQTLLRASMRQLTAALTTLHAADRLHLDIKPSNVLVTPQGRVVVLDFGLAMERTRQPGAEADHTVSGTLAYMAPEQAMAHTLTPAADWYAVGAMLYQALTGHLPFEGTAFEVFTAKQERIPEPPRSWNRAIPETLDRLCVGLLATDPRQRLGASDVLTAFAADALPPIVFTGRSSTRLLGRADECRRLSEALQIVAGGQPAIVYVHGASGMGKTALVEGFLDSVRIQPGTLVLTGRCYEQESVQYKALDGLVDALARYLVIAPASDRAGILPPDVAALSRLFPVLDRVETIHDAPRDVLAISSEQELRDRASATLRKLLHALASRARLVLAIDDLQWGDVDSARLINDLMSGPDAPPLLLVGSYRTEHAASSRCLQALLSAPADRVQASIDVGPLDEAGATQLATAWLGPEVPMAIETGRRIVQEAGGSPYFIRELVEYVKAELQFAEPGVVVEGITLDESLRRRLGRLKPGARRLLEVIAVASRPIDESLAYAAAELTARDPVVIGALRNSHLVQSGGLDDPRVETYHDRIREAVIAQLSAPVLRQTHERLAAVLEGQGHADPEWLGAHLEGAGHTQRASEFYARAAAGAAGALAFDRAAELYRRALAIGAPDTAHAQARRVALGDALANAGRASKAGDAYLDAARTAPPDDVLDLQRRAGYQLFISGRAAEGRELIAECLRRVGMTLPATARRAMPSLMAGYVRLRILEWLGRFDRPRERRQVSQAEQVRLNVVWAAAAAMTDIAPVVAASLQARHLLLALRAGDIGAIVRGLSLYARWMAYGGQKNRERTRKLVAAATRLAEQHGSPYGRAMALLSSAWADLDVYEWTSGFRKLDHAEDLLRTECTGVAWELTLVRVTRVSFHRIHGLFRESIAYGKQTLAEALQRGDLYTYTRVGMFSIPDELALDNDHVGALRALQKAVPHAMRRQFPAAALMACLGKIHRDLGIDQRARAWRRCRRYWPIMTAEGSFSIELVKMWAYQLRAGSALAAIDDLPAQASRLHAEADRAIRVLERMSSGLPRAHALNLRATVAIHRGDRDRAIALFDQSASWLEAHDVRSTAAATRRCQGLLIGGSEGRRLVESADAWFRVQRFASMAYATSALVIGLPRTFLNQSVSSSIGERT
jgi:eukaryotic-like serine/threonine-protein kinase